MTTMYPDAPYPIPTKPDMGARLQQYVVVTRDSGTGRFAKQLDPAARVKTSVKDETDQGKIDQFVYRGVQGKHVIKGAHHAL